MAADCLPPQVSLLQFGLELFDDCMLIASLLR